MVCPFLEIRKVKYINELLEVNLLVMEKDRLIEPAQSQIGLAIVCYILYLEKL